jgi:hypothetical protein
MGTPWLTNLWGCNVWQTEPERTAVGDTDVFGTPATPIASDAGPVSVPLGEQGDTPAEWLEILRRDWPEVPPVIDPALRVTEAKHKTEIESFLRDVRRIVKERIECFDRADYQLYLAGYKPSNRPPDDLRSYLVFLEVMKDGAVEDQLDLPRMLEAIEYVKTSIMAGVPVIVGLRLVNFSPRDMDRPSTPEIYPTNHFVVVVGASQDNAGPYFTYLDSRNEFGGGTRLYLLDTMFMKNPLGHTLSEVRTSIAR